jgi:hypothetical protein
VGVTVEQSVFQPGHLSPPVIFSRGLNHITFLTD